jgi:origin recognition complex subunit 2
MYYFEKIVHFAKCGFSVLIHGYGSKIDILNQLVDDHLQEYYVIRIQGFQQNLSLSRCLSQVLTQVLKKPPPKSSATIEQLADEIARNVNQPLAWVVDSIDAPPLRESQEALATVSRTGLFFATGDHFRLGLLWDDATYEKFKWLFKELNSFEDYRREVIGVHGACFPAWCGLGQSQESASSQSLAVVLRSLTPHHTSLVKLVASMQLKEVNNYVKGSDLLKQCRKEMLATNHSKLKSLLHELLDHAIIKTKKESETGNEIFYLSGDKTYLEKIVSGAAINEVVLASSEPRESTRGA